MCGRTPSNELATLTFLSPPRTVGASELQQPHVSTWMSQRHHTLNVLNRNAGFLSIQTSVLLPIHVNKWCHHWPCYSDHKPINSSFSHIHIKFISKFFFCTSKYVYFIYIIWHFFHHVYCHKSSAKHHHLLSGCIYKSLANPYMLPFECFFVVVSLKFFFN